jgi:hypothetical protein
MTADNKMPADQVLAAIAARGPIDYVVWAFEGDRLNLRGGRNASGWSDLEIVFHNVIYMALPVYMSTVTIRAADDAARRNLVNLCNCDPADEPMVLIELIEDDDWPEGRKRHLVAAEAIAMTAPAPEDGD